MHLQIFGAKLLSFKSFVVNCTRNKDVLVWTNAFFCDKIGDNCKNMSQTYVVGGEKDSDIIKKGVVHVAAPHLKTKDKIIT